MITKEIATSVREAFGKGPVKRMRAEGKTPGVVYSGGKEALALELEESLRVQGLQSLGTHLLL